jgi:hypothetical protein
MQLPIFPFPFQCINLLPNLHPPHLLSSKWLPRVLERFRHDIAEFGTERFDNEHGFPVGDGEAGTVAVEDEDACVHLEEQEIRKSSV